MKAARAAIFSIFLLSAFTSLAQEKVSDRALLFADSLHRVYFAQDWNRYVDLSCPGMIEYFGGQRRFKDYLQRSTELRAGQSDKPEAMEIKQLVVEENDWQCVVKKITRSIIDGKKASVVTYLVGQSKDAGKTWQFVDVSFTSPRNLFYIIPDLSAKLIVPERNVIFEPVMALN